MVVDNEPAEETTVYGMRACTVGTGGALVRSVIPVGKLPRDQPDGTSIRLPGSFAYVLVVVTRAAGGGGVVMYEHDIKDVFDAVVVAGVVFPPYLDLQSI